MQRMAPQTSSKLTYEDYAAIPDDGHRHEIIDGEHYMNPAPNIPHQIVLFNVSRNLHEYVRKHRLGRVLPAAVDVVLNEHDIVQPDIIFVSAARAHIINRKNIQGAPDLVVEILSDSNRRYDERVKFDIYERGGVSEYWIVDPDVNTVNVFRRAGSKLSLVETGDPITTPLLPGFELPLSAIFEM